MKHISLAFLTAVILLTACTPPSDLETKKKVLSELKSKRTEIAQQISDLEAEIAEMQPVEVKAKAVNGLTLSVQSFEHKIEFQGTADTDNNITLMGEANGSIERIAVTEGNYVEAGQLLLEVDAKAIQANRSQLESALDLAKTTYERQARLWDQKIGTEMQFLQSKNQVESIEAQLQQLDANLENFELRSPISGFVDQVFVKEGESMMPGSPMIRIVNLSSITVTADVSEAYVQAAKKGKDIEVRFPSIDRTIQAKISAVGQVIDPANRTFKVEVNIPNKGGLIKPNMLAILKMNDYTKQEAIVVPAKFVQSDRFGNNYVFVGKKFDGAARAVKEPIIVGQRYNGMVEVTSGLKPNNLLITDGSRELSDRMIIDVKDIQKQ